MRLTDVERAASEENVRDGVQWLQREPPHPAESDQCTRGRRRRHESDPHTAQQPVAEHGRKNSRTGEWLKVHNVEVVDLDEPRCLTILDHLDDLDHLDHLDILCERTLPSRPDAIMFVEYDRSRYTGT